MGIFPVRTEKDYKRILGFSRVGRHFLPKVVEGYAIPYLGAEEEFARIRLRFPIGDAKYLSPQKGKIRWGSRVYFLPEAKKKLASPKRPLLICEGEKKCAKAHQEEFPDIISVGIPGIVQWAGCPERRKTRLLGRKSF